MGDGSLWNDAGDLHFNGDQGLEPWTAGPLQRRLPSFVGLCALQPGLGRVELAGAWGLRP